MLRRRQREEAQASWFFQDRPISGTEQDLLDLRPIAEVLKSAIESAEPPCMIGLQAGFGKGKSSTTNMAAEMLRGSRHYDVVTVTADKHSGNERARNLVHGIAGEIQRLDGIKSSAVTEILRPLRQSSKARAPDPTDMPLRRLEKGRYSAKEFWKALATLAAFTLAVASVAFWAGAELKDLLTLGVASPALAWIAAMTFKPVASLLEPATVTDQTPRAEAADEIEEVFGLLVDHHRNERERRLVVIVDDLDRLGGADLLDALRTLRSLQSVPRGNEPVFVISWNEEIALSAVGAALRDPDASVTTDDGEQPVEPGAAQAAAHDRLAAAFIDKLLTARVSMPATMRGSMRSFAHELVHGGHPLRAEAHVNLEEIMPVLIDDGVEEPRSVVRLLNRFVAAYLLARSREDSGSVARGDITHHLGVLAQVCVLFDRFAGFHAKIVQSPVLLQAASKVALRQTEFTPSEAGALESCQAFCEDSSEESGFAFKDPALGRYLSSTARRIRYPADVSPLVCMASTQEGRVLGFQMCSDLRRAVASGDYRPLADVVSRVAEDSIGAAGSEVAQMLLEASPVDASTYIAAVAPNLTAFGEGASRVADACVDLLERAMGDVLPADRITEIITHSAPANGEFLCRRLLAHDDDPAETNKRYAHAAGYLADNPGIRRHVESAIASWLSNLPAEGGWPLGAAWLDPADGFDSVDHQELLRAAVTAMAHSIRSDEGFTAQHGDRLIALAAEAVAGDAAASPSSSNLLKPGPNARATLVRLWEITGYEGDPGDCLFAAGTAADSTVPADARRVAVERVVAWVDTWAHADLDVDEGDGAQTSVAEKIVDLLLQAARDTETLRAVVDGLPLVSKALAEGEADDFVSVLLDGVASVSEELRDERRIPEAESSACQVIASVGASGASLPEYAARLLSPINTEADPADPAVQMALRLVHIVAGSEGGEEALSALATEWSSGLRTGGDHDGRTPTDGFQALSRLMPQLIEQHAESIMQSLEQHINAGYNPSERLLTVALFPWPTDLRSHALQILDSGWEQAADETRAAAFALLTRSDCEGDSLARFHDRLIAAIEAGQRGRVVKAAVDEIGRMSDDTRGTLYAAAVGTHDAVTQMWSDTSLEDAAAVIAGSTEDDQTVERLIEAIPVERRAALADASLVRITSTEDVPEAVVDAVARYGSTVGLRTAADTALSEIEAGSVMITSALRVLAAAKRRGTEIDKKRLTDAAVSVLPSANAAVGGLFGRLFNRIPPGRRLMNVVKNIRQNPGTATVAEAFDAARLDRRRR